MINASVPCMSFTTNVAVIWTVGAVLGQLKMTVNELKERHNLMNYDPQVIQEMKNTSVCSVLYFDHIYLYYFIVVQILIRMVNK